MTTRCVIYARFSPRRNEETCPSCKKQAEACRAAAERKGYEVTAVFEDAAMSGDDVERPGLWGAIDALDTGGILMVRSLDRLARSVYLMEIIRRKIQAKKARIESVEEASLGGDTPEELMVAQIMSAAAEYQKKLIAARTKAAMRHYVRVGRYCGGQAPYGWRKNPAEPKLLVKIPEEQAVIEQIVKWRKVERLTFWQIAAKLNEQGAPKPENAKAVNPGSWRPYQAHRIYVRATG